MLKIFKKTNNKLIITKNLLSIRITIINPINIEKKIGIFFFEFVKKINPDAIARDNVESNRLKIPSRLDI